MYAFGQIPPSPLTVYVLYGCPRGALLSTVSRNLSDWNNLL